MRLSCFFRLASFAKCLFIFFNFFTSAATPSAFSTGATTLADPNCSNGCALPFNPIDVLIKPLEMPAFQQILKIENNNPNFQLG